MCLELSRPVNPLIRLCYKPVLAYYLPLIGKLISSHRDAYQYLSSTIQKFYEPHEVTGFLEEAGFEQCAAESLTFGTAHLYSAIKQERK